MAQTTEGLINKKYFQERLLADLNKGMRSAAEPILNEALEQIEKEMRKKLASMVVAFIDGSVEIDRFGEYLRILVKHEHHQSGI